MNRFLKILTIAPLFCASATLAQTNANSPYSYYGIGELDLFNYSRTAGMGGVTYGIKSNNYINNLNPASYANIDSLRFMLDVTASGNFSQFKSTNESYSTFNGNFKRIALGFRIHKLWGMSMGIMPYSNVGYKVFTRESIIGSDSYSASLYSGIGGLTKAYFGNSIRILNNLSVGFNTTLLFGYINKTKTSTYSGITDEWVEKYRYKPVPSLMFDFGIQYSLKLKENLNVTAGLVGGLDNRIKLVKYFSIYSSTQSSNEEKRDVENFYIPMFYGGGLSVRTAKWVIGADYHTQLWENVAKENRTSRFVNTHHIALGAEYCPDKYLGRNLFQRMSYQFGAHYDRTALTVLGQNYDIYGLSVGVAMPLKMQLSNIAFSIDFGTKGKNSNGLFRENYLRFNLGISFADFWFMKRQYD